MASLSTRSANRENRFNLLRSNRTAYTESTSDYQRRSVATTFVEAIAQALGEAIGKFIGETVVQWVRRHTKN